MRRNSLLAGLAAVALLGGVARAAPGEQIYELDHAITLKGAHPAWDYLTFDAARSRLFIGRRAGGVTVFDVKAQKVVGQIARSEGANIAALVPEFGRGYTSNADGSTTIFDLASLKTLDRVKLGDGADSAFYDPATKQVVFTMGDSKQLTFVDAKTGKITGRAPMQAEELEGVAPDGEGLLYVAERDVNKVARVDARQHRLLGEWPLPNCEMPSGVALDRANSRLMVGCRGDKPVLTVLDINTGKVVAQPRIGHGNDAVIYDAERRKVFTSNGVEANLVIFDQAGPDSYKLAQALATRPVARTLAMDPATKTLYSVTAEGMVDPTKPVNTRVGAFYPNVFFDDTFTLLEFGLHAPPVGGEAED